ncbi:MAG: DUF2231 domain-containing protein [Pseudonocardiaceae bacterium]
MGHSQRHPDQRSATTLRCVEPVFGSYIAAGLFDLLSALPAGFVPSQDLYRAATYLLIMATTALVLAAATGFRDRARWTTPGSESRRLANAHTVAMAALGALAVLDIGLRSYAYPSATNTPLVILMITALLCAFAGVGGRLGGTLVYRLGVGTAIGSNRAWFSRADH